MKTMKTTKTMTLVIAALMAPYVAGRAQAEEKKIDKAAVPKPVIDAVMKKYPAAKIKGYEQDDADNKITYEVSLESGKDKMDIDVSPEGKILAEETIIPKSALPAAVKASIAGSKYKGWTIQTAEKVIHEEHADEPAYEIVVTQKKEKVEVVFDKAGKITKEEVKDPKDKD